MTRRDLAALLTVLVVAVPGLAIAQDAPNDPVEEIEDTETPAEEQTTADDAEHTDDGDSDEDAPETQELAEEQAPDEGDDLEDQEEADEADGHGAAISALARCLPSGRQLHGTGWTKGAIISQAASTGEVSLDDQAATAVETPEDAEAVCAQVQELVAEADAPDRAKGRPAWAGQDDEEAADDEAPDEGDQADAFDAAGDDEATGGKPDRGRGGPPSHANGRGRG